MNAKELEQAVLQLKKEKNAIILAHYYQTGDIQDIADYVGDSLGLAQKAAEADADMIVFAGVHFMAETAKILNPNSKVIIPDLEAGCSLAASAPADKFRAFKEQYPDHKVISYINCTAELKTMTDIVCTSGNALEIVNSLPKDEKIIFAPDRNLGGYINRETGRNMVLWDGTCEVHDILTSEHIIKLKVDNPDAKLLAHPECQGAVLELADHIGSTTSILKYARTDSHQKYIVATESGILHQMRKESPDKEFIIVPSDETCACNDCPYMKLITMEKIYNSMVSEEPQIHFSDEMIEQAKQPIDRMLSLSKELKLI
jgi:quinolinate synthase